MQESGRIRIVSNGLSSIAVADGAQWRENFLYVSETTAIAIEEILCSIFMREGGKKQFRELQNQNLGK